MRLTDDISHTDDSTRSSLVDHLPEVHHGSVFRCLGGDVDILLVVGGDEASVYVVASCYPRLGKGGLHIES